MLPEALRGPPGLSAPVPPCTVPLHAPPSLLPLPSSPLPLQGPPPGPREALTSRLASQLESKFFYLDLKENQRGYYLKVSEKGAARERSTVVVPADGVPYFAELFRFYAQGGVEAGAGTAKNLQLESKVFFFEVGENPRGRYLRINEGSDPPRGRSQLIVPSGGDDDEAWGHFADKLDGIRDRLAMLEPHPAAAVEGPGDVADNSNSLFSQPFGGAAGAVSSPGRVVPIISATVPAQRAAPGAVTTVTSQTTEGGSHVVRSGNKRFFFDVGSNPRGTYMRITEASQSGRMSLMIPQEAFQQFYEAFTKCLAVAHEVAGEGVAGVAAAGPGGGGGGDGGSGGSLGGSSQGAGSDA